MAHWTYKGPQELLWGGCLYACPHEWLRDGCGA